MRLFNFIRRLIGNDENSRIRQIDSRISELHCEKMALDKKLEQFNNANIPDLSWFNLSIDTKKADKVKSFITREFGEVKTMKQLFEKRKSEEKRKKQLEANAYNGFDSIRACLRKEDVDSAEFLLYQITKTLNNVRNDAILELLDESKAQIASAKETHRQKDIERQERVAKAKAEYEERERQEQLRKSEQTKKVRLENERNVHENEEILVNEEQKRATEIARLTSKVTCKKENAQVFLEHLKSNGVMFFYHFTDASNLMSIKKYGGLYSWYYCEHNDIVIPNAGGSSLSRELDHRQGLEDYVRLSFCCDHPMAWRKKLEGSNIVLLKIKVDVAAFKDTQFSNVNAAADDNIHGKSLEDLQRVNIQATQERYVSRESPIFHEHQAECMVKTFIPIEYIININNPLRVN